MDPRITAALQERKEMALTASIKRAKADRLSVSAGRMYGRGEWLHDGAKTSRGGSWDGFWENGAEEDIGLVEMLASGNVKKSIARMLEARAQMLYAESDNLYARGMQCVARAVREVHGAEGGALFWDDVAGTLSVNGEAHIMEPPEDSRRARSVSSRTVRSE